MDTFYSISGGWTSVIVGPCRGGGPALPGDELSMNGELRVISLIKVDLLQGHQHMPIITSYLVTR